MTDKVEEVMAVSEEENTGECDNGTVSPPPATIPKKRGRPANLEKPKKIPSGRGRGRPKAVDGGNKKPTKAATVTEGSEEDGTASDGGSVSPNGDEAGTVPSKRGRHPKRKHKLPNAVETTGKGRGRPKKIAKTDVADDDDEAADDDDAASGDHAPVKKAVAKAGKKGRGRPKKVQNSDDESSDDAPDEDVVTRSVGRPATGGINLNIARTGKGQGRPKKAVASKRAANTENGDGKTAGRLGRPPTVGKVAYLPTGKPRGRPKLAVKEKDSQDDDEENEDKNKDAAKVTENSSDEVNEDETNSEKSQDEL